MLSSPYNHRLDHRSLVLTRLAQRSLTLQPGNSLISLALTLSVGFSISIALNAATQARRLLAFTAVGLPSPVREGHPMDHDSSSSGHTIARPDPQIQTALYRILETLVHLMAPVLSFTAEEIWEHMPKKMGAPESIFLSAIPLPDEAFIDEGLATRWDQTFRVREEVLKVLEECRKPSEGEGILGHIIGHSLDAEIFLDPDRYDSGFKEVFRTHNPQAWEDIFIVSKVKVGPGGIPDSFRSDQEERFAGSFEIIHPNGREGRRYESPLLNGPIMVFKAQGQKCERCWKYSEDVGRNSDHPTVCVRCSSVLRSGAFA